MLLQQCAEACGPTMPQSSCIAQTQCVHSGTQLRSQFASGEAPPCYNRIGGKAPVRRELPWWTRLSGKRQEKCYGDH